MRWIWIFLWIALSAIQLVLFVVNKWTPDPPLLGSPDIRGDLVDLARETNRGWSHGKYLGDSSEGTGRQEDFPGDGLDREGWILRFSELQQRLDLEGVETRFMDDLERWLSMHSRIGSGIYGEITTEDYLSSVYNWISPFLEDGKTKNLVLVRLEPGTESLYPDLHFELNGSPEEMGELLFQSAGSECDWSLRDMELYCRENLLTWWMQGTCAFLPLGSG